MPTPSSPDDPSAAAAPAVRDDAPSSRGAPISRAEVAHVARLARLRLTDDELDRFTEQLGAVLAHAADVEALDLHDVAPTAHPLPLVNVVRADQVVPGLDRDEVMAAAPDTVEGQFRVPTILGEEP